MLAPGMLQCGVPFALEETLHWADRLLDALEYLHEAAS